MKSVILLLFIVIVDNIKNVKTKIWKFRRSVH